MEETANMRINAQDLYKGLKMMQVASKTTVSKWYCVGLDFKDNALGLHTYAPLMFINQRTTRETPWQDHLLAVYLRSGWASADFKR